MAGSARGTGSGGAAPGSGDGQGDSPLAALSEMADQVRAKVDEGVRAASERFGPDVDRVRGAAEEKLKSVGVDLGPSSEILRGVKGGVTDFASGSAPKPPFEQRPELYVGAAFAGGVILAGVIRLLGR